MLSENKDEVTILGCLDDATQPTLPMTTPTHTPTAIILCKIYLHTRDRYEAECV